MFVRFSQVSALEHVRFRQIWLYFKNFPILTRYPDYGKLISLAISGIKYPIEASLHIEKIVFLWKNNCWSNTRYNNQASTGICSWDFRYLARATISAMSTIVGKNCIMTSWKHLQLSIAICFLYLSRKSNKNDDSATF